MTTALDSSFLIRIAFLDQLSNLCPEESARLMLPKVLDVQHFVQESSKGSLIELSILQAMKARNEFAEFASCESQQSLVRDQ